MKYYKVAKYDAQQGEFVADYGVVCEKDMLLTVRGYKRVGKVDGLTMYYTRKNSKYIYVVDFEREERAV